MPETQTPQSARPLLAWTAQTQPELERGKRWYTVAGVTIVGLAAYGILTGQWTFTLVVLLMAGMYVLTHRSPPLTATIAITERGILFNDAFISYSDLEDFWLLQGASYIELRFARKKRLAPEIVIQLGDQDHQVVRSTLQQFLPERSDQRERLLDTIIRICKL